MSNCDSNVQIKEEEEEIEDSDAKGTVTGDAEMQYRDYELYIKKDEELLLDSVPEDQECGFAVDPLALDPLDITKLQVHIPTSRPLKTYSRLMQSNGRGCRFPPRATNCTREVHDKPGSQNSYSVPQKESNCNGCQLQAGVCRQGGQLSSNVRNCPTGDSEEHGPAAIERSYRPRLRVATPCSVCGKIFESASVLRYHMKIHSEEQPITRGIYHQYFSRQNAVSELKTHDNLHTGTAQYKCQFCGKSFKGLNYFTYHQRLHTGERKFFCKFCGRYFTTSSYLKIHERVHTGGTPFVCDFCNKGFLLHIYLTKHLMIHKAKANNSVLNGLTLEKTRLDQHH